MPTDLLSLSNINPLVQSAGRHTLRASIRGGSEPVLPDHDLQMVYKGSGYILVNDQEIFVECGDIITLLPGEMFQAIASDNEPLCRYYMHIDFFQNEALRLCTPMLSDGSSWPRLVRMADDIESRCLFTDIIHHKLVNDESSLITATGKFLVLAGMILAQNRESCRQNNFEHIACKRSILKAEEFIRENYRENIGLETLAETANLSLNYFGRMFKSLLGKSPIEYLIDYRISQAKRLFLETEHNVSEVACLVGYEDVHHFSNVFKQREGISPSSFLSRFSIDE